MPVDVGSAIGYLDLDISGFLRGVKEARTVADGTFESMAANVGGMMSSIGDTLSGAGQLLTAGFTAPLVSAVTTSVKQFANLEQSLGGIETMFKDSAGIVIKNAEDAYKTAGQDANAYMEQVTSFSATLLQGLGGDTEAAAEYAQRAIVDMSDNANKFGTDIGSIQYAYQGFAKQNYTMLDNLKLGYGGTQEEMARLINDSGVLGDSMVATAENVKDIPFATLIDAIHVTQENLGVTGTTALEASETVTGSFMAMKAAALNFLQQLGNPDADMEKFTDALIESVGIFVGNVKRVLSTMWDNIPLSDLQKKMLTAAAAFGPVLLVTGKVLSVVGAISTVLSKVVPQVVDFAGGFKLVKSDLPKTASAAAKFGKAFAGALGPIAAIVAIVGTLVAAFMTLWNTNEQFRDSITAIWEEIVEAVDAFVEEIVNIFGSLGIDFNDIAETLKSIWMGFCNLLAPIFVGAFEIVSSVIQSALSTIVNIIQAFKALFTGDWSLLWTSLVNIVTNVFNLVLSIGTTILNTLKDAFDVVLGWFGTTWEECWTNVKTFFETTWNDIKTFVVDTIAGLKSGFVTFVTELPTTLAGIAQAVVAALSSALMNIALWAISLASAAKTAALNFVSKVGDGLASLPLTIGLTLLRALIGVATWVTSMGAKGVEGAQALIDGVLSLAELVVEKVAAIGQAIIDGVWAGIQNAKEQFIEDVKSFFTGLVDSVKSALGIGSPSRVFAEEVGKWLPPGVAMGFKDAMPKAIRDIDAALDDGVKSIDAGGVAQAMGKAVASFADVAKSMYGNLAVWFESVEARIGTSIGNVVAMMEWMRESGMIVGDDGTIAGYIGYSGSNGGGGDRRGGGSGSTGNNQAGGGGDTFIFNSPKPISEIEAARQMKEAKRDLAEGF